MKKILLVIIAVSITAAVYAQTDSVNKKMSPPDINNYTKDGMNKNPNQNIQSNPDSGMNQQAPGKSNPDALIMENGKMMVQQNGKMTMMTYDMIMNDGTKVLSDGTCIKKDGTKTMLKNGQRMDISGKIIPVRDSKNMYPDTMMRK